MIGSIISGVTQLGSAIYGAAQSAKLNNKARALLEQSKEENQKWYEQKMSEDYMSRSDVQNALSKQREMLNRQYNQAAATNVVAGGTDEALALQKAAANKSLSDTMSDIAANASSYKDSIEQQYLQRKDNYTQQQIGNYQNQANSVAQAASQVGQATGGLGEAIDDIIKQKP